ncbi:MAG: helix-turn-helix domain-containing protein [Terrimicrobiaceae bacterium]
MCHRSLSSFKREFRRCYGTTPGKWLIGRRLECAAQMLRTTSMSMTEIALECGFEEPSHFSRTFSFTDPPQDDRPLSRMPFFATVCAGCAALCLGIAQAATDSLLELAASKIQVDPFPGMRDRPWVQTLVASSAAKLASARLLLHSTLSDVWAACTKGTPVTERQRARLWESGHHAAQVSRAVVRSMYEAAGTSALYVDCPIERAHRDVHAVMQHVVFAPLWLEAAGQVRLGLTPQNPIF